MIKDARVRAIWLKPLPLPLPLPLPNPKPTLLGLIQNPVPYPWHCPGFLVNHQGSPWVWVPPSAPRPRGGWAERPWSASRRGQVRSPSPGNTKTKTKTKTKTNSNAYTNANTNTNTNTNANTSTDTDTNTNTDTNTCCGTRRVARCGCSRDSLLLLMPVALAARLLTHAIWILRCRAWRIEADHQRKRDRERYVYSQATKPPPPPPPNFSFLFPGHSLNNIVDRFLL